MCEIVRAQWAGVTVMAGISQRNSYHLTRASPLRLRPTQWGPYKYSPQLGLTSPVSHFKIISSSGLSRPDPAVRSAIVTGGLEEAGETHVTNLQLSVVLICLHPICGQEMIRANLILHILLYANICQH